MVVWVAGEVKLATRIFLATTFCAAVGFHLNALGGLSAVTSLLSVQLSSGCNSDTSVGAIVLRNTQSFSFQQGLFWALKFVLLIAEMVIFAASSAPFK